MEHPNLEDKTRIMYWDRYKPPNVLAYESAKKPMANHHILPIAAVGSTIDEAAAKKEGLTLALQYFTEWNINDETNLILLPTRAAYEKRFGKSGGRKGSLPSVDWDGYACHSWAHNRYSDQVKTDMTAIWNRVKVQIDEDCNLVANSVKDDIVTKRGDWEKKIKRRKTTIENWRAMRSGKPPLAHNHFTMVRVAESPF